MHAPHHVRKEWSDKYKGQFDEGWDVYREKTFARQKEMGLIPADAELSRHDPDVAPWDSLSADEKRLYAHMMESSPVSWNTPITISGGCLTS
jgi:arylsulfatase A-like enzyme